jgi:purine-nucleoside phosphorylase
MLEVINHTIGYIRERIPYIPETGIVLGTGLGALADEIEVFASLSYSEIPNFPVSTVKGHPGRLIFGRLNGRKVVAMQGRFHYYEGYSMKEVTFPIRVLKYLGIQNLILSNAAGGINPEFEVGDIMVIRDHINLMGDNPLLGKNDADLGPRFTDMSNVYDQGLIQLFKKTARHNALHDHEGVYAAVSGPCFETPAEYKYIRLIGADAVGMSTVPEAIVARHMSLPVFAVSVISDLGVEGKIIEISHDDVIDAAEMVEPKLTLLLKEMLGMM